MNNSALKGLSSLDLVIVAAMLEGYPFPAQSEDAHIDRVALALKNLKSKHRHFYESVLETTKDKHAIASMFNDYIYYSGVGRPR